MSTDGRILSQGLPSSATLAKGSGAEKDAIDEDQSAEESGADTKNSSDGKLIATEEIAEGHVGRKACETSLVLCGSFGSMTSEQ